MDAETKFAEFGTGTQAEKGSGGLFYEVAEEIGAVKSGGR